MISVHQFWDNPPPPAEVMEMVASWQKGPTRTIHRLWTDRDADAYLDENFGRNVVDAYRACAVPAMKADLFRYCVLFREGGIYADADVACIADLGPLLHDVPRVMLFRRQIRIANDFMYFGSPRDPLLERVIGIAARNIALRISNDVWRVTGPGIMTALFREDPTLFTDVSWIQIADLKRFVKFNWTLSYKQSPSHWTTFQKSNSIFRDAKTGH
jgi:mannosyltransferase OCH1-like enzyme